MLSFHEIKVRQFGSMFNTVKSCRRVERHIVKNTADALLVSHGCPIVFLGVPSTASMRFWLQLPIPVTLLVKGAFRLPEQLCWHAQKGGSAWNLPSPTSHPMTASWQVWKPSPLDLHRDNFHSRTPFWDFAWLFPLLCSASPFPYLFPPGPLACESSLQGLL